MSKEETKFLNFSLFPRIFAFAGPTMLEQLMQTLVQYIDVAMVASLGTLATAAVGSTTTVNWLLGSTVSALGIGFLSYISQSIGAKEIKKAKDACAQAVLITILTGIIFTLIPVLLSKYIPIWMQVDKEAREEASAYLMILYLPMLFRCASVIFGTLLRSAGDARTPMRVGIIVNIANVILNFLMIYPTKDYHLFGKDVTIIGLGWGVRGAACASAVSYALGGIIITIALLKHKTISPVGSSFKPNKTILKPCLKIAFPNMLQRFFTSLGYVVFASLINSLGQISTAAHTIANTVESAFYIPGYGMMAAAATLTGNAIGARDNKTRKETSRAIIAIEVSLMIISGSLLFIFAPNIVSLFSKDKEASRLATTVLKMVALSEPFYGVSIVIEGMLQGAGETKRPFIFSISCMWVIRIVGTFIFVNILGHGLVSAWSCMIANNLCLFLLFLIYYLRVFKKIDYSAITK